MDNPISSTMKLSGSLRGKGYCYKDCGFYEVKVFFVIHTNIADTFYNVNKLKDTALQIFEPLC